jgi:Phosphopantetheine attachment site
MELIARLEDRFGVKITLPTLFRARSLLDFAHHLETGLNASKDQERTLHFSDKQHY